jgi:hypothetical protein
MAAFWVKQTDDIEGKPWTVMAHFDAHAYGESDPIEDYATKAEARAAMHRMQDEHNAIDASERMYRAQYAYACGERD